MFSIPAQTAIINSIIGNLLLAGVFLYLWRVDKREHALGYWAAAYAASALRALFRQIGLTGYPSAIYGEALFGAAAVVLLWMGARVFAGKPFASPRQAGTAAMAAMGGVAGLAAMGVIPIVFPYLIAGGVYFLAGLALLKRGRENPGIGYGIVGFLFALYGGYVFAFSHLISQPGDPKSYLFGPIINLAIGMVLLVVTQRKQYSEAEKLNAALLREAEGRRTAEDVVLRSEQRYRAIVDTTRSLIGLLTPEGILIDVNRTSLERAGIQRQDAVGKLFWETPWWTHDEAQQQRLKQAVRRVAAGGHDRFEATHPAPEGGIGYFNFFLTPIRDTSGQVIYLVPEAHDITALRRAEQTLHAAEQRFRAISEGSMLGVFVTDPNGKGIYFSRRATEITGVTEAEVVGGQAGERLHPDDQAQHKAQWRMAIAERKPFVGERRYVRRDGNLSWSRIHVAPILEGEALLGFVGTIEDINARKATEQALRESEERFSSFFALSPEPVAVVRYPNGEYIRVNEAWENLLGYREQEVVGRTGLELGLWEKAEDRHHLYEELARRNQARSGEIRLRRKNGELLVVLIQGRVVSIGQARYILWGTHDLTESRRMEQALKESEEKFSTIFHRSPVALGVTSIADGRYIDVNDAWETQFRYPRERIIGRTSLEIGLWLNPEERRRLFADLETQPQVQNREVHFRCGDGAEILCELSGQTFELDGRKVLLWGAHDVTEHRRVQHQIEELNMKLEARVSERTSKLERANAELGEAMESLKQAQNELVRAEKLAALGSLVAGVAHELNTPIGNSVTVASTLHDRTREFGQAIAAGPLKRSILDGYLEDVRTASELLLRSLSQANDLVGSFKQVAVDQASAQRRRFDLKLVVEEVALTLAPMLKKTPFKLELELADNVVMDSYPGSIGQVVTNLVTNSLAHAFENRDHGLMQLKTWRHGLQLLEMTFTDDGAGIPESDLKRIFDPFFTTRLGRGGSGLGLHIVYNLVTRVLGGRIEATSQPGVGTRFQISLPMKAPDKGEREL